MVKDSHCLVSFSQLMAELVTLLDNNANRISILLKYFKYTTSFESWYNMTESILNSKNRI